jgi:hypothetical protein
LTEDPAIHSAPPTEASSGGREQDSPPLSGAALAMVFAALAVALVLGYLLLNKLVDISTDEDCALANRRNCAAMEVPVEGQGMTVSKTA